MPDESRPRPGQSRPATGIVHLGLGAFFRAFGCVYIADAMAASGGDWGIVGVSLRSPDTRDALRDQDWGYTSVTLAPESEKTRWIDVLNGVLVAPEDPAAVLEAMADPAFFRQDGATIAAARTATEALEAKIAEAYARWEALSALEAGGSSAKRIS